MTRTFRIEGLDCPNCTARLERKIAAIAGVSEASLGFMTGRLNLTADEADMARITDELMQTVAKFEPGATVRKG